MDDKITIGKVNLGTVPDSKNEDCDFLWFHECVGALWNQCENGLMRSMLKSSTSNNDCWCLFRL